MAVDGKELNCNLEALDKADVEAVLEEEVMNEIVAGRMTFQRAFMGGSMKIKGDFKLLRTLDELFMFMQEV